MPSREISNVYVLVGDDAYIVPFHDNKKGHPIGRPFIVVRSTDLNIRGRFPLITRSYKTCKNEQSGVDQQTQRGQNDT